jgi:predicted nuclease with TOPRIM domain
LAGSMVMQKIQELSEERERLVQEESRHGLGLEGQQRLHRLDHDLQVLWDLRRRELAGEMISLDQDYYDSYDRYTDTGEVSER